MSSDPTAPAQQPEANVSPVPPRPSTPPPEKRVISALSNDPSSPSTDESSAAKKIKMDASPQQQQHTLPGLSNLLNPNNDDGGAASTTATIPNFGGGGSTAAATALPALGNISNIIGGGSGGSGSISAQGGAQLLVKKLNEKARAPTRGSAYAAGYDMYASEACVVPKGGKFLVETGLSMAVPEGCYGRVAPRSGLASKNFIDVGAGVIDSDYRGPVKILLFNHSDVDFEVHEGDRVAQLILERIYTPEVMVVESLEESVRGAGGFGSSGR